VGERRRGGEEEGRRRESRQLGGVAEAERRRPVLELPRPPPPAGTARHGSRHAGGVPARQLRSAGHLLPSPTRPKSSQYNELQLGSVNAELSQSIRGRTQNSYIRLSKFDPQPRAGHLHEFKSERLGSSWFVCGQQTLALAKRTWSAQLLPRN
jgi:hypothetical protein